MAIVLSAYNSVRAGSGPNEVTFRWTRDAGDPAGGWHLHDSSSLPVNTGVTWNIVNGSGTPIAGSARSYDVDYTTSARYLVLVARDGSGNVIETSNEVYIAEGGASTLTDDPGEGGFPAAEPGVYDDFSTGTEPDPEKWYEDGGASVSGGHAVLTGVEQFDNQGLSAVATFDMKNRAISVRLEPVAGTSLDRSYSLVLDTDDGSLANFSIFETTDYTSGLALGGAGVLAEYDPVAHLYLRVREYDGTLYYETSPDGTTWTLFGSEAHEVADATLALTLMYLWVAPGSSTDPGDFPATAHIDDVIYWDDIIPTPEPGGPYGILFVGTASSYGSLTVWEQEIADWLVGRGHSLTYRLHTDALPSTWTGVDLVVISPDALSNQVNPKYNTSVRPVVSFDARKLPHGGITDLGFTQTSAQRTTFFFEDDTTDVSSPLYSGSARTVYPATPAHTYAYVDVSNIATGAIQWMGRDTTAHAHWIGFGVPIGTTMQDASTLDHRVAVIGISDPGSVTDSAITSYMDRVLDWAANSSGTGDVEPPTAPTVTAAVSGLDQITVSFSGHTDNVGVVGYRAYRGTSPSFEPGPANLVADEVLPGSTEFVDTGLTPGSYYYKVVVRDAVGLTAVGTSDEVVLLAFDSAFAEHVGGVVTPVNVTHYWDGVDLIPLVGLALRGYDAPPWEPGIQPTNTNTGLPGVGNPSLTLNSSTYLSTPGQVYYRQHFPGGVTFTGAGTIVRECKIDGEAVFRGNDMLIEDTDAAAVAFSGAKRFTAQRVRITGLLGKDGFHITSDTGRCEDGMIRDSFIGNPVINDSSHYDSIQIRGIDRLTIQGNTMDHGVGFDSNYNATVFLQDAQGGNYDVTIQGNWLRSAGYNNVRLFGFNVHLFNNVFYPDNGATPVIEGSYPYEAAGNTWADGSPLPL